MGTWTSLESVAFQGEGESLCCTTIAAPKYLINIPFEQEIDWESNDLMLVVFLTITIQLTSWLDMSQ